MRSRTASQSGRRRHRSAAAQVFAKRLAIDHGIRIEQLRVVATEADQGTQHRVPQLTEGFEFAPEKSGCIRVPGGSSLENVKPCQPVAAAIDHQKQTFVPPSSWQFGQRAAFLTQEPELIEFSETVVAHQRMGKAGESEFRREGGRKSG